MNISCTRLSVREKVIRLLGNFEEIRFPLYLFVGHWTRKLMMIHWKPITCGHKHVDKHSNTTDV